MKYSPVSFPLVRVGVIEVLATLLENPAVKSAANYIAPNLSVVATRRGHPRRRDTRAEILLTIGKPNYRGRAFVKACLKAGEPFPVRKVRVRRTKGAKRA